MTDTAGICEGASYPTYAVPVPVPGPVASNTTPTVFDTAPIKVKFVVPTVLIVYVCPTTNAPETVGGVPVGLAKSSNSTSVCLV